MLQKTHKFINGNEEWSEIEIKAKGAVNFFFTKVNLEVFQPLLDYYSENKGTKGLKEYNEDFRVFLDDLEDYLNDLKKVYLLEVPLFNTENNISISTKVAKIPSHILSFQLFEEGKTIPEIAKERGLVTETIFGHLAKFAEQGLLDLSRIFDKAKIKTFEKEFKKSSHETLNDWKKELPNDFEFNEIRLLLNHFTHKKSKTEK